jgi:hypothetical protein
MRIGWRRYREEILIYFLVRVILCNNILLIVLLELEIEMLLLCRLLYKSSIVIMVNEVTRYCSY